MATLTEPVTPTQTKTRIESDSMGKIEVPSNVYWGRRRSARFCILILEGCHASGADSGFWHAEEGLRAGESGSGQLAPDKAKLITLAADEVIAGKLNDQFRCGFGRRGRARRPI